MAPLPQPRGETSALLVTRLGPDVGEIPPHAPPAPADPLTDEDLELALYTCYELHYRGFDGVHPEWEWEPSLLRLRRRPERLLEDALLDAADPPHGTVDAGDMDVVLRAIAAGETAPPLSRFVQFRATLEQTREFLVHRS